MFFKQSFQSQHVMNCINWFIGILPDSNDFVNQKITQLFNLFDSSNYQLHFLDIKLLETIKLTHNSFIASQIAFFNEIFTFSQQNDIDYTLITQYLKLLDLPLHSQVPGPDNYTGFNSNLMKDVISFSSGFNNPILLHTVVTRNLLIDRKNNIDFNKHFTIQNDFKDFTLSQLNLFCSKNKIQ